MTGGHEGEQPPPPHPAATATTSFDPRDAQHVRGASQAFGHLFDGDGAKQSAPGLAGPPRFDLGDRAIGTTHYESALVYNTDAYDAGVHVAYEGSPAVHLTRAPTRLRPSREGNDLQSAIELAFAPTAKGHHDGALVIDAAWQAGGRAPERLHIPVTAAAHEVGQPDIATEEAEQREHAQAEAAAARDHSAMEGAKAEREKRLQHGQTPGNAATREALHEAAENAATAMTSLLETRLTGVQAAEAEASKYHHREPPPYHESLLHALAMAALDVATAGIAGALGKRLEEVVAEKLTIHPRGGWWTDRTVPARLHNPSKAVVAFFTDSVKDVVKLSGKAATSGGHHGDEPREPRELSSDPLISFFMREKLAVIRQNSHTATLAAQNARYALEPMLDVDPNRAIAAMRGIAANIEELAGSEKDAGTQLRESALHWMRYVAETSLGSVDSQTARSDGKRTTKDGNATTNITGANAAPSERGAPSGYAGLVDIEFSADVAHPGQPITVSSVHVDGVSNAIARHLAEQPLLEAGVAVRAHGKGASLEAIRDEAGNVEYVDDTGAPGMPGHWLQTKAGEPTGGRDAAMRGARMLIEEAAAQFDHPPGTNAKAPSLETDSDDR